MKVTRGFRAILDPLTPSGILVRSAYRDRWVDLSEMEKEGWSFEQIVQPNPIRKPRKWVVFLSAEIEPGVDVPFEGFEKNIKTGVEPKKAPWEQ